MTYESSNQMHDQTERPGQLFPQDVHNIIKHRYDFAASLAHGKKILEVGAGHGIAARLLKNSAKQYVAGEYSDENIELISEKPLTNPVVQFDAHQLPFVANSFDLIIALAMIYYLDFEKFLQQARLVLNSQGKLFFCTSNKDVPGFVRSPYTTQYYSIPELNHILKKYGFDCEFYGVFPAPGGNVLQRKIKSLVKRIAKECISHLPNGKNKWQGLRAKKMGVGIPLPWHVDEILSDNATQQMVSLPVDRINQDFRIIYGVATLKFKDNL